MKKKIVNVEVNGVTISVDQSCLDNMELIDALAEVDGDDDIIGTSKVVKLLLGTENRKKLYDAVRNEDGAVPIAEVTKAVQAIFKALGEAGKNS